MGRKAKRPVLFTPKAALMLISPDGYRTGIDHGCFADCISCFLRKGGIVCHHPEQHMGIEQ